MDHSQLPDASSLLVTADSPARRDLLGVRMDHERCAALHNYLLHYAWIAERRAPASLRAESRTFFTAHGAAAAALRPRLDPSLAAFLESALLRPADPDGYAPAAFFWWVSGLSEPNELFGDSVQLAADTSGEPADSLLCLYSPNVGPWGPGGGLVYHQGRHLAAFFMHMDDYDFAMPIGAHPELWHPLETVLSNWVELVHLGKIAASPIETPSRYGSEKFGPWEWRPYGEAQVDSCIAAWDRLCDAIEARVLVPSSAKARASAATASTSPGGITVAKREPLVAPAVLDAASVPESCFVRSFLTRARRPGFRYIAPGLTLPPADATEFAALQSYTRLPRDSQAIPPVCLFPAAQRDRTADVGGIQSPFCHPFWAKSERDNPALPTRVPAGVYSESVDRTDYDNAEEGFRLLLPYGLEGDQWQGTSMGARKSDGSLVSRHTAAELFQHGYKPFGGDYYRPQRLERLLDHWRKLVDEGVWSVGPEGVKGSIETFRKGDTVHARDYIIPPTW